MKPHLPIAILTTLLSLTSITSVQAADIPADYEQVDLWTPGYLDDYTASDAAAKCAFILWSDTAFTPQTNTTWTDSQALVTGREHIFTTAEGYDPAALSFTGGASKVFQQVSCLTFDTLSKLNISAQSETSHGGSINLETSGNLTIQHIDDGQQDTADLVFNNNKISASTSQHGGAIYANGADTEINISHNGGVQFSENSVANTSSSYSYGGAIYSTGNISIHYNTGIVQFTGNRVSSVRSTASGGAIYSTKSITINNNAEDINFTDNYASTQNSTTSGGAIYSSGNLTICDNEKNVIFSGNHASSNETDSTYAYGGAIYSTNGINISNNGGNVCFEQNYAYSAKSESYTTSSGAYYPPIYYPTTTTHYYTSDAKGGAIYSTGSVIINNNDGHVTFRNNSTEASAASSDYHHAEGGAIYSTGSISIAGNSVVTFEKNYEKQGGAYWLRSIYLKPDSASDTLVLAARTRGHIAFYDSVYMAYYSGCSASMNADYTDANGALQKATGDIIFSGKYTAEHLAEVKGSAGTSTEITNSQTSAIDNLITLYGGSLQVVDGAKLNGRGLTVAEGSGARLLLRDGSMSHGSYNFTFNNGTSLELQGLNTITAKKLALGSDSALTVTVGEEHLNTAALTLGGTDLETSKLTVNLNRTDGLRSGMYKIISQASASDFTTSSDWTAANVCVNGSGNTSRASFEDLVWENGTLYYKVGRNIWANTSGDSLWNSTSDNWTMNDRSYTYLDGMDVSFTDTAAGTVKLDGDIAAADILVNNSEGNDYTFSTTNGGKLTGTGGITKQGAGALTIATANEHTGDTSLEGGTLNLHHSTALGATATGDAALTTAAGTSMNIAANSHLVLAGSNSMAGEVAVEAGSTLEMKGSGYAASASTVNGTLAFTGTAAATDAAGSLSGTGSVQVTDSAVSFASQSGFTGNLGVNGKSAALSIASGNYTGAGQINVEGGTLTFGATANLTLNSGGALKLEAMDDTPAELSLNNLNVKSGATLLAQAELQDAVSLNVDDVVGYAGPTVNSAVGGVLDCTRVTLNMGSTLALDNAHFDMNGGTLTLAVPASASGRIELVLSFDAVYTMESQVMLFSNLGTVNFIFDNIAATPADATTYTMNASDYFVGAGITEQSELIYDSGSNVLYLTHVIPESSTTTLGLTMLMMLCARRRRRA